MNKRRLHHLWTKIRPIRPWYFLAAFAVSVTVCVLALRNNNLTAIRLRNEVNVADKQNGDVEGALRRLRQYVYAHMNTNLSSGGNAIKPPIQLKYRYDRLVQAQQNGTDAAKIYTDAQAYCEQQVPEGLSGRGRVPCIQQYVTTHGAHAQPIPDSLYKFDFVSPFWSPDLAGWSLLASILFLILFIIWWGMDRWLRSELS